MSHPSCLQTGADEPGKVATVAMLKGCRIGVIGPLAPPNGGMAGQTAELLASLQAAGLQAELLATNSPYRPSWTGGLRGWRALIRLFQFTYRLWSLCGRVQILHIMANSGWSWHLFAAPAIWIARLRGVGILLNYRGGNAPEFLRRQRALILPSLHQCDAVVVPSSYLQQVFAQYQLASIVIPNMLDLGRYFPSSQHEQAPVLLMTRHLEAIYDHATAIRAFQLLSVKVPSARLLICGDGPERRTLEQQVNLLGLAGRVEFTGALDANTSAAQYRRAHVMLNTSQVDNAPNAILEAWASGIPIVSTRAGGIPHLVQDEEDALLAPVRDPAEVAKQLLRLLQDSQLYNALVAAGLRRAKDHDAQQLMLRWQAQYQRILLRPRPPCYTLLVARLLFPLHEYMKRHASVAQLSGLERSQWQSPELLRRHQEEKLHQLLTRAARQVPYYRNSDAYRGMEQIHTITNLASLPVLRKSAMRQQQAFIADNAGALKTMSTGGSSGEPLRFHLGKARISHDVAARWRCLRWWGVEIGDREALMWGSPIELGKQDRLRLWRDRLFRSLLLPAFDLKPATLDEYLCRLRSYAPRIISGYPSALCTLVSRARERGIRLDDIGVRVIFVTAERLYDEQRALLERSFGAPVANGYGARDAGFIAHECPAGGMHIAAEDILVEILDEHDQPVPPGQSGEIVVTHLASGDFPFIRYATGDRGAISATPCICGRSLPLLKQIDGRSTDFVVASDGTVMHGLALIYILRELSFVRMFRIIQESRQEIQVQLVLAGQDVPDLHRAIIVPIRQRLGETVNVALEIVSHIAPEATGKYRYIINRMPSGYTGAANAD